jgi:hypothetical protein
MLSVGIRVCPECRRADECTAYKGAVRALSDPDSVHEESFKKEFPFVDDPEAEPGL